MTHDTHFGQLTRYQVLGFSMHVRPIPSLYDRDPAIMSRDISPPPTKRIRTDRSQDSTHSSQSRHAPQKPPPLPDGETARVISWNVNGIDPFLQRSITSFFPSTRSKTAALSCEIVSLREFLHRHHWPAIVFLQEVKIARADRKTQDAVRAAVNAALVGEGVERPAYETHFVLPSDPHNARGLRGNGKVYGVATFVRTDIASRFHSRITSVDWDREGRVSIVELHAARGLKIALYNLYAVNGTDNPYRDPATGSVCGTRHDRKLEFHRLLMEECCAREENGWHLVLAGDMNVAPDERDGHPRLRTVPYQHVVNRADFRSRFLGAGDQKDSTTWDGVDVWREMHGDERRYTYFPPLREWGSTCDRVDYVVAGRRSFEQGMITAAGILDSPEDRGTSDHVPVWVDINLGPHNHS